LAEGRRLVDEEKAVREIGRRELLDNMLEA